MNGDWIGRQLGNYRLVRLIGHGGYADVYLGEHIHLKTNVAVKILHTQITDADIEDFRNEARLIAHLTHPHIIRVFDFTVAENTPFIVMDYAPNGTLRQRHPKRSRLEPATFLPYVMDIASALQYAHDQQLIHRDVKPENMLLGFNNEVLLSDFGTAVVSHSSLSQTTEEMILGTIAYMAPEQLQGRARPASDQYALAVVVYEWLSGSRPFQGTYVELLTQHLSTEPPVLDEQTLKLPHAVQQVIRRALAKDPHARFARVQDFANALEWAYRSAQFAPSLAAEAAAGQASAAGPVTETTRTYQGPTRPMSPQAERPASRQQIPSKQTSHPERGSMLSLAAASTPQITSSARSIGRGLGRLTRVLLIMLLLAAVLICGVGYAAYNGFFANKSTPAETVNQAGANQLAENFMQAVSTQNYDQAYSDLGRAVAARDQFTRDAQSEDRCNGPVTTYKRASTTARGNTLVETYQVTRSRLAQTYQLTLTLQGDSDGRWQITDYRSGAPACSSS